MASGLGDVHLRVVIDEPADLLARLARIETAIVYLTKTLTKEGTMILSTAPTQPDEPDDAEPIEPEPAQPAE
jgi:hypothetical protein